MSPRIVICIVFSCSREFCVCSIVVVTGFVRVHAVVSVLCLF